MRIESKRQWLPIAATVKRINDKWHPRELNGIFVLTVRKKWVD